MIHKEREEKDINIFETKIIHDDYMDNEEDENVSFQLMDPVQPQDTPRISPTNKENEEIMTTLNIQGAQDQRYISNEFSFDLPHIILEGKEPNTLSPQDKFMRWHLHLNHLPFKRICKMAKEGFIAKENTDGSRTNMLSTSIWQDALQTTENKSETTNQSKVATRSGKIVSMDQLQCTTPGFIVQLKGKLTKQ